MTVTIHAVPLCTVMALSGTHQATLCDDGGRVIGAGIGCGAEAALERLQAVRPTPECWVAVEECRKRMGART